MNPKLEKQLYEKYPKIFRQKDLPMSQTCMCWGIDTCEGWYWLIDNLCGSIQGYIDANNHKVAKKIEIKDDDPLYPSDDDNPLDSKMIEKEILVDSIPQVEAAQVKEKYGGLRFYVDGGDDMIDGMIWLAEHMSYSICEVCGTTKNVTVNETGWITTRCKRCRAKEEKKRNSL